MKYCNSLKYVENPVEIINQYTEHTSELYKKINFALAADSEVLRSQGEYITNLRNSILSQPLYDDCLLYRGVSLSKTEIAKMEELQQFFIPSFTSTSVDSTKAYQNSSLMVIKLPYACKYAASITDKLSKYYHQEREVLISCYSAFRLERIENQGRTQVISLYLDEYLTGLNSIGPAEF